MSLDPAYLQYEKRRYGMDHDRYEWSMLTDRPAVQWPGGARLAVWINISVQFFPLNQSGKPFAPPGGMSTAYPDLRHFTLREYGNRIGLYRCLQALEQHKLKPTFSVNAILTERNPALVERLIRDGNELICSSWSMDTLHHGGMTVAHEATLIKRSLEALRKMSGQPVRGWFGPARSQSLNTPDLLRENGVDYMCDWVNDDMPYRFRTHGGNIMVLPLSNELEDQFIIHGNLHSEWEYAQQVMDACDFLLKEAKSNSAGRLLALSIHPWLMGQPHRIGALESALSYIAGQAGVVNLSASEIGRVMAAA